MHGKVPQTQKVSRTRRATVWGLVILVFAGLGYYFYRAPSTQPTPGGRGRFNVNEAVPVLAAAAKLADVPVYLDAVGTTKALNTVTVRPQVDGKLISINFDEGQDVKKGDVLAKIDPVTYQAALDQAIAKKAQDEALLANAKIDLDRYERLAATNAINRQQADTQKALVAQYTAQVQSDQAAIESAQATLGYTSIVAPIDARTGIRQVDVGNIVHASDSTGIVVLTQITPIAIFFNLPQQNLDRVNAAFAKGALPVEALLSDTDEVIARGNLTVIDNQIDPSTGTVRLKAEFPNPDFRLWPGQFLNVRLLIDTLRQVVVVPTGAVQRGPNGTFVFVVKDDNTVAMKDVTVGQQDEAQAVITKGVEPPQRVVTTGFVRLTDGSKVAVATPGETPSTVAPAQGRRNRGGLRPPGGATETGAPGGPGNGNR